MSPKDPKPTTPFQEFPYSLTPDNSFSVPREYFDEFLPQYHNKRLQRLVLLLIKKAYKKGVEDARAAKP